MGIPYELLLTGTVVIVMTIVLVLERFEVEQVIFSALMVLLIGKVLTLKEAFAGFSNEGMLTIALMFVVAGALSQTGMLKQINPLIFGRSSGSVPRKLIRLMFPVSFLSAFINNTPVVAMMIPAIRSWAEKNNFAPSKFLIPLSYAAIMGGMCTLIGTATNLIVHGLMLDFGLQGMSLFEIGKIGLPIALYGMFFIVVFGHRLLPNRREPFVELGEHTREFVIELKVTGKYEHLGKTIEQAGLRHLKGLYLFQIERNGEVITPAPPNEHILSGDRLFFTGIPQTILELQQLPGLELTKDSHFDLKGYDSAEIKTYECVISASSPLVGKSVRECSFRDNYQAVIIAIHRHGERIEKKIGDIELHAGDTLLLLAPKTFRDRWYHSKHFYLIAGTTPVASKPQKQGYIAVGVLLLMITLTFTGVLPLLASAGLATMILVFTKTVSSTEARRMIDWRVLVIIAMSLGIASAVQKSGLAALVAGTLVDIGGGFGPLGVLTAIYLITSLYNTIIVSSATAALIFPIAISAAESTGSDPRGFAIAVAVAAVASFASPISYQTNMMVSGPGGYQFRDFLRIGIPLQATIAILAIALIYFFYL